MASTLGTAPPKRKRAAVTCASPSTPGRGGSSQDPAAPAVNKVKLHISYIFRPADKHVTIKFHYEGELYKFVPKADSEELAEVFKGMQIEGLIKLNFGLHLFPRRKHGDIRAHNNSIRGYLCATHTLMPALLPTSCGMIMTCEPSNQANGSCQSLSESSHNSNRSVLLHYSMKNRLGNTFGPLMRSGRNDKRTKNGTTSGQVDRHSPGD